MIRQIVLLLDSCLVVVRGSQSETQETSGWLKLTRIAWESRAVLIARNKSNSFVNEKDEMEIILENAFKKSTMYYSNNKQVHSLMNVRSADLMIDNLFLYKCTRMYTLLHKKRTPPCSFNCNQLLDICLIKFDQIWIFPKYFRALKCSFFFSICSFSFWT